MNRFMLNGTELYDLRAGSVTRIKDEVTERELEMLQGYMCGSHVTAASLLQFLGRTKMFYSTMTSFCRITSRRDVSAFFHEPFKLYQRRLVYEALGMGKSGEIWSIDSLRLSLQELFHNTLVSNYNPTVSLTGDYQFERFLPDFTDPRARADDPRYIDFGLDVYTRYRESTKDFWEKISIMKTLTPSRLWGNVFSIHSPEGSYITVKARNRVYLPTTNDPEMNPYVTSAE